MLATAVEFSVAAPVAGVGEVASPALDGLVAGWRGDKAVSSVAVEWRALPRTGEELVGSALVRVDLRADTRGALRAAYDRLTRQVARDGTLRLGGRSCVLSDMCEQDAEPVAAADTGGRTGSRGYDVSSGPRCV